MLTLQPKNLTNFLATIPLVSLSVVNLNFSSAAVAASGTAKNTQASKTHLLAQQVYCSVVKVQSGQLALRFSPDGKSKAGLNNGDTVSVIRTGSGVWRYVRVIEGPNSAVNGLEGWVNSNYLACGEASEASRVSCDVVNIRTGQLALRFTPDGKSKAGLNNGNTVRLLRNGSGVWRYVRVINRPNSEVNGLEGWVNSNYLSCHDQLWGKNQQPIF